jgi:hypothetical protein
MIPDGRTWSTRTLEKNKCGTCIDTLTVNKRREKLQYEKRSMFKPSMFKNGFK